MVDFRSENVDSRFKRADFRLERARGIWMDGQIDRRMNESPPVFYMTLSSSRALPCFLSPQITIMQSMAMDIADHILPSAQTQNPFGAIDPSHNLMPTYTNSGALDTADPLSLLLLFKLLPKILHFMYRVLFDEQNQWLMTEADLIILKLDPNQNFPLMIDGSYY